MRSRDLRLIAVGLGGLALVLGARAGDNRPQQAVAIDGLDERADVAVVAEPGGSSSGGEPVVVEEGLADQLVTVVSDRSIRLLDFGVIEQPLDACEAGLLGDVQTDLDGISLDDGHSGVIDDLTLAQLTVDDEVAYGDITGNGVDEAIVHTVCEFGASGREHQVQVWDVGDGSARLVGVVPEPSSDVIGELSADVLGVEVGDGLLEVTWSSYAEDDPNCCPSGATTIGYQIIDGTVAEVGEPVTTDQG